ncbi:hypothetical protein RAS1_43080 [Phycisphaerae bacterium RAS1]|nr:hypothetical protein RAS1_43080 [Phycisphaerae bacterium RAS1]
MPAWRLCCCLLSVIGILALIPPLPAAAQGACPTVGQWSVPVIPCASGVEGNGTPGEGSPCVLTSGGSFQYACHMIHITALHDRRILAWGQHTLQGGWPDVLLIDPFADPPTFRLVREGALLSPPPEGIPRHQIFCSGHTTLSDGRVYIAGGTPYCCEVPLPTLPLPKYTSVYDINLPNALGPVGNFAPGITECWDHSEDNFCADNGGNPIPDDPSLACGDESLHSVSRYYPTVVHRGNGEVLVVDGPCRCLVGECSTQPVVDPPAPCLRCDGRWGNAYVPLRVFPALTDPLTWKFEPLKTAEYRTGTNPFNTSFYPHIFQVSDGSLFYAGGYAADWEFGSLENCPNGTICSRKLLPSGVWTLYGGSTDLQGGAAAIYYRRDPEAPAFTLKEEVIKAGRVQPIEGAAEYPLRKAYRINLSDGATASWTDIGPMPTWRNHFYIIGLPDGRLAAIGQRFPDGSGTTVPVDSSVDIYDPQANSWCTDASNAAVPDPIVGAIKFGYHSSGVLTYEGSIFMGLQPHTPVYQNYGARCQIYSPAYCGMPAQRPQIVASSLPPNSEIYYGSSFSIDFSVPVGASVTAVRLIRPGSATHSMDVTQRMIDLDYSITPSTGRLRIIPPSNPNIAPPAWYMLFICTGTHASGLPGAIPSKAEFVRLRNPPLP